MIKEVEEFGNLNSEIGVFSLGYVKLLIMIQ